MEKEFYMVKPIMQGKMWRGWGRAPPVRLLVLSSILTMLLVSSVNAQQAGLYHEIRDALPTGLASYWSFDEVNGAVVRDSTGNKNDGIVKGGPILVKGRFGMALKLDGVDDYVEAYTSILGSKNQLTISVWIYPDNQELGMYRHHKDIIRSQCFGGGMWGISTSTYFNIDSRLLFQVGWVDGGDTWWAPENAVVAKGRWNHLVLVLDRDSGRVSFYRNGILIAERTYRVGPKPETRGLRVSNDCAGPFKGAVDEIAIYNRALTADEIKWLYKPSPTIYFLDISSARKFWTDDAQTRLLKAKLDDWQFKTSKLVSFDEFDKLILDEGKRDVIIVNAHGEAVPIPDRYVAADGTPRWDLLFSRIRASIVERGWVWINIAGYPFFYVSNLRYTQWSSHGMAGLYTVGEQGLKLFLDDRYATAWSDSRPNAWLSSDGRGLREAYGIPLPDSVQNIRMISSSLKPDFIIYSWGEMLVVGGYRLGKGYFINTYVSQQQSLENSLLATLSWLFSKVKGYELVLVSSSVGKAYGSGWYPKGSEVDIFVENVKTAGDVAYLELSPATRYLFISWEGGGLMKGKEYRTPTLSIGVEEAPVILRANWRTQHFVAVHSDYGNVFGSGWYNEGETVTVYANKTVQLNPGTRVRFDGWIGDISSKESVVSFYVNSPKKLTASWKRQYLLKVVDPLNLLSVEEWIDENGVVVKEAPRDVLVGEGVRMVFRGWEGSFTSSERRIQLSMDSPKYLKPVWKKQFYVEVLPGYERALVYGGGWYDGGATATIAAMKEVDSGIFGVKYVFEGWFVNDRIISSDAETKLSVNSPTTLLAKYRPDYTILLATIAFPAAGGISGTSIYLLKTKRRKVVVAPSPPSPADEKLRELEQMLKDGKISFEAYRRIRKEVEEGSG
ncbi:MAG: LamG domain-containing protein [Nitrososphaerota archaeon]